MAEHSPAVESSYTERIHRSQEEAALLSALWRRRPRVVVKADLLPAVSVLSTVALVGLGVAWIWSRIAPPQRVEVVGSGQPPIPLPDESYHHFDDLAVFVLASLGAGLMVGAAVWLLRERRGPVTLIAAALGSALGSWLLAMPLGVAFAQSRYPIGSAANAGQVLAQAPQLESGWLIVAQPLGVVLAYGLLTAWNGRADLGRRLG